MEGTPRRQKARAVAGSLAGFIALTACCMLFVANPSFALRTGGASDFSLGGSATVVHPGNGSPTAAELTAAGSGESHVNMAIHETLQAMREDRRWDNDPRWRDPRFQRWDDSRFR